MIRCNFPLLITLCLAASPVAGQTSPQGRLLFLGVAYDEAPPQGSTADNFSYAPDNFTRIFEKQSKPLFRDLKVSTLKGLAAHKAAVGAQLFALQKAAKKDDLVFIYWGTHGGTSKGDWGANLPGDATVSGSEIKQVLAGLPCPAIVLISTCGSGSFIRKPMGELLLPPNVAAAAACGRKRSASNELDITMLEALAGFADADGDEQITLREAFSYLPKRYAEFFRDDPGGDIAPVFHRPEGVSGDLVLAKVTGDYAAAVVDGAWYGVTVLEIMEGKAKVRFLGYDSTTSRGSYPMPDQVLDHEYLDFPGDFPPAEVESEGVWYPAKVLQRRPMTYKIHYVGYPDSDDAVVPPSRIRFPFAGTAPEPKRKK